MNTKMMLQQADRHHQGELTSPIGIDGFIQIVTVSGIQTISQIAQQMLQNIGMTLARRRFAQGLHENGYIAVRDLNQ